MLEYYENELTVSCNNKPEMFLYKSWIMNVDTLSRLYILIKISI